MAVGLPDHLYIRIGRALRDALRARAAEEGVSVSTLVRRELSTRFLPRLAPPEAQPEDGLFRRIG